MFLDLNNILEILRAERNHRPIPMRLIEQMGNRNLPTPQNEDLEAGTNGNSMARKQ